MTAAGDGLEGAVHVREVGRLPPGGVPVEAVGVRQRERPARRPLRGTLALPGLRGERVQEARLQRDRVPPADRLDVGGVHELVGRVGGGEVRRPHMHGTGGQSTLDGHRQGLRRGRVDGLQDRAVVAAVGRLQRDVAAVRAVAAEVPGRGVEVRPPGRGELRRVRDRPGERADPVRAGPWLVGQDQAGRAPLQVGRDRGDQRPVEEPGHPRVEVPAVEAAGTGERAGVEVLRTGLARPQRLTQRPRDIGVAARLSLVGALVPARVVGTDDVHRGVERRIGGHVLGSAPALAVVADELDLRVVRGQCGVEVLVPGLVVAAFVPAADVVDGQAVALRAVQPFDEVVDGVGGPEGVGGSADPARCPPGQGGEFDGGVAGFGLGHQPPFVAAVAAQVGGGVHVRGFGAVGGVGVAADLDFEDLQGGAVAGFEQVVQDLAALWFGVVGQQAGVAAAAGDRADAVEGAAALGTVDGDRCGGGRVRGHHHHERRGGYRGGRQQRQPSHWVTVPRSRMSREPPPTRMR